MENKNLTKEEIEEIKTALNIGLVYISYVAKIETDTNDILELGERKETIKKAIQILKD